MICKADSSRQHTRAISSSSGGAPIDVVCTGVEIRGCSTRLFPSVRLIERAIATALCMEDLSFSAWQSLSVFDVRAIGPAVTLCVWGVGEFLDASVAGSS